MTILFFAVLFGCLFPSIIAVLAGWDDWRALTIPNRHALVLAIAWPFLVAVVPFFHVLSGLIAAAIVLCGGLILFGLRVMGAGDVKLATVFALYSGLGGLGPLLLQTCLWGGALALIAIGVRHYAAPLPPDHLPRHWLDRLRQGSRDLPYGIALGLAFITVLGNIVLPYLNGAFERG